MISPEIDKIILSQHSGDVLGVVLILIILVVASVAGAWKTFSKAGQPGWAALIPIYNLYVMLEIGDNDWWWLLVMVIPVVNLYALYKMYHGVSRAFGQGRIFALGLLFLPLLFFPLLGFGNFQYGDEPGLSEPDLTPLNER